MPERAEIERALREQLQILQCRHRLALAALDGMQRRVAVLNLPIEPRAMILGHVDRVRRVLQGEVADA
jgi:hypothetical protein